MVRFHPGSLDALAASRCAACGVAVARGPVKAEVMGFDSPRAALIDSSRFPLPVWHDPERHRARNSDDAGAKPAAGSRFRPPPNPRTSARTVRAAHFVTISIRIVARCDRDPYDSFP